ncbi:MAG TPA: hypothetical protein VJZ04_09245 [Lachnospiraceae bacterium]|nr:hypothetical protein [Lachnospiraceae bacterium]
MESIIVIHTKEFKYHKRVSHLLTTVLLKNQINSQILDISSGKEDHEYFFFLQDANVDFIIDFDMVGFRFQTEGNESSYTTLPCRIAVLLFNKASLYHSSLGERMNFSTFLYCRNQDDRDTVLRKYTNVPNICNMDQLELMEQSDFIDRENLAKLTLLVHKIIMDICI